MVGSRNPSVTVSRRPERTSWGTPWPAPTSDLLSPEVGRNQCSFRRLSTVMSLPRRLGVELVGEEGRDVDLPGQQAVLGERVRHALLGVDDLLADRNQVDLPLLRRGEGDVLAEPGLLGPDLRPVLLVRLRPDLGLGDPADVVLQRGGRGRVVEGGLRGDLAPVAVDKALAG